MKPSFASLALACSALLALGCSSGGARWSSLLQGGARETQETFPTHGIVAFSGGWIGVVDTTTQTVSEPFLVGQLGVGGAGLFDPALTRDGKTALVSSFGENKVHLLDLTQPAAPALAASVTLSFFAEDIALTPDDRFALVTDGGVSPKIAVIDVASRTLVEEFDATPPTSPVPPQRLSDTAQVKGLRPIARAMAASTPNFCAVSVAPDGKTVLSADYFGAQVHVLTLDAAGHLTYVKALALPTKDVSGTATPLVLPVNISISPDGKTAIAAGVLASQDADGKKVFADMVFPVFRITGPGQVEAAPAAHPTVNIQGAQSVAFSYDGKKAYLNCVPELLPAPATTKVVIVELDVTGAGQVAFNNASMVTEFVGTSQLFGVDTLVVEPTGKYLYVSNPTMSDAQKALEVFDLATRQRVKTISFTGTVSVPGATPTDPATDEEKIPAGLAFARH